MNDKGYYTKEEIVKEINIKGWWASISLAMFGFFLLWNLIGSAFFDYKSKAILILSLLMAFAALSAVSFLIMHCYLVLRYFLGKPFKLTVKLPKTAKKRGKA